MLNENAQRGLNDLFYFLNFYWGLTLEEVPHREMCDAVASTESDTPMAMLVVPRGTYKTSIARGAAVWKQLRQIHLHNNPYHRIAIVSATLTLGRISMRVIEDQLRYNKLLNEDYGPLWEDRHAFGGAGSRREDGIILAPRILAGERAAVADPSFWVGSTRAIATGRHADEALVDDLNNRENVSTGAQRLKTHEFWSLLFPIIGSEDGGRPKIVFLATPWHDDDVRGKILREEKQREVADPAYKSPWSVLHHGSIREDGTAFFPSKYPLSRLEDLRQDMAPREFAANYLCDPIGDRGFVDEDAIIFKQRNAFPALRDGRITVDPHQHKDAKELGCYAAIIVAAYDRFANMYVLDARGARQWDTKELIDQLFRVSEDYPNFPIYIEDSHMGHFDHAVKLEQARRSMDKDERVHLRINWSPVDYKTSKYERWERLQPRFANRAIIFAEEIHPAIKNEIREELIRGQAARFHDFLDALAMAETGIRPKIGKDGHQVERPMKKGASREMTFADAFGLLQ